MGNKESGQGAFTFDLNPDNKIGEGSFANIYKVQKKETE